MTEPTDMSAQDRFVGEAGHGTKWWHRAVIYQIYVRSFADLNGDGIGDLAGIRSRLPYLRALGVDGIWLTPCFPSPQFDHGYDVADYFNIEPVYGTLSGFDELVAEAHGLRLRIMLDVVPNHCSWDHAWFRAALTAAPDSPERARFYFRDGRGADGQLPPNNWVSAFGGPAWRRVNEPDGSPGQWYLHTFAPQQPDLDWDNPEVAEHFDRMLTFWFDRGVDGFRADAVTSLGKASGLPDASAEELAEERNLATRWHPAGHRAWRRWRQLVNRYEADHPGRELVLVAEAYTPRMPEVLRQYVNPDEFHQAFSFDLLLSPWTAGAWRRAIGETLDTLGPVEALPTWTLNNHDTQRSVTRYGRADADRDDSWRATTLDPSDAPVDESLGLARARAAFVAIAALPGNLYLYQGEELGLPEVLDLDPAQRQDPIFAGTGGAMGGRDGSRIPLPWNDEAATNYGFSTPPIPGTPPAPPWLPQPPHWGRHAMSTQHGQAGSTLELYRRTLRLRRTLLNQPGRPTRADRFAWLDLGAQILAFRRGPLIVAMNFGGEAATIPADGTRLPVDGTDGGLTVVLSSGDDHHDPGFVPANATLWLAPKPGA